MKHFSETYFFCYRHTHTYIYIVCSYYQPSLLWSQPLMENTQVPTARTRQHIFAKLSREYVITG